MASKLIDSVELAYGTRIDVYDEHLELVDARGTLDVTRRIPNLEKLYWALHEAMKKQGIVVEF